MVNSVFTLRQNCFLYNELSQKTRFQTVPIAELCLYNIQHENLVFLKISLYIKLIEMHNVHKHMKR